MVISASETFWGRTDFKPSLNQLFIALGHFTVTFIIGKKKRNVLFNETLNTFYLRIYGVGLLGMNEIFYLQLNSIGDMLKDNLDNEKGNLLPLLHLSN